MPPTNPQEPDPVKEPETKEPQPLTQADLDNAVAESNTAHAAQITQIEKDNQKNTNELIATMNQQRFEQQVPAQAVPGITEAEFAKAIEEGEADTVAKYMDQKLASKDKAWEEKFGQMQSYGLSAIGDLAKQQASNSKEMPYYGEFKEQIEGLLKQHNASDPVSIKNAYDLVVGQNMTKIITMEAEKKARQANDPAGSIAPGDANLERGSNNTENFDVDKAVSAEAKKALAMRHDPITLDQYTQKLSRHMGLDFKDFETMHKKREELIKEDKEFVW